MSFALFTYHHNMNAFDPGESYWITMKISGHVSKLVRGILDHDKSLPRLVNHKRGPLMCVYRQCRYTRDTENAQTRNGGCGCLHEWETSTLSHWRGLSGGTISNAVWLVSKKYIFIADQTTIDTPAFSNAMSTTITPLCSVVYTHRAAIFILEYFLDSLILLGGE